MVVEATLFQMQCFISGANRRRKRSKENDELLRQLWMEGYTIPQIADVLDTCYATIVKWKNRLKLPRRMGGTGRNNEETRRKQRAYMSLQVPPESAPRDR